MKKGKNGNGKWKFPTKEEHFKDFAPSLFEVSRSERLTDLRLVCEDQGRCVVRNAHQRLLARHSTFLQEMFITNEVQQPGQPTYIFLADTRPEIVENLLEYLYCGSTRINRVNRAALELLCSRMKLKLKFEEPLSSESSESDASPPPASESAKAEKVATKKKAATVRIPSIAKKQSLDTKKKINSESASTATNNPIFSSTSEDSDSEVGKNKLDRNEMNLKSKAKRDKGRVLLEPVEKTSDFEVKKLLEKSSSPSLAAAGDDSPKEKVNPLFKGNKHSAPKPPMAGPHKRRMTENDKKVETKESKKMKQDESSSEIDSDSVTKRKLEMPRHIGKKTDDSSEKKDKNDASDHSREEEVSKENWNENKKEQTVATKKIKPGPASSKSSKSSPKPKKKVGKSVAPIPGMFATQGIQICNLCNAIFVSSIALAEHRTKSHQNGGDDEDDDDDCNENSSSSESPKVSKQNEKKEKPKKKSAEKIKEERRKRSSSSSSTFSTSDDDKPKPKPPAPKSTPRSGTPKIKLSLANGSSSKKDKTEEAASTPKRQMMAGGKMLRCHFCIEIFDKPSNLKNHVVNHFKADLLKDLPQSAPYICPICSAISRDKITLLRHYGFGHKKLFDFCSAEDVKGKIVDGEKCDEEGEKNMSVSKPKPASKAIKKPKEAKVQSSKAELANSLLTTSDDSDDEKDVGKKEKENEAMDKAEGKMKEKVVVDESTPTAGTSTVKFSDDSDEEFGRESASAKEAIKTFDQLFVGSGDEKSDQSKKKAAVTFNKDSDDEEPEPKKKTVLGKSN